MRTRRFRSLLTRRRVEAVITGIIAGSIIASLLALRGQLAAVQWQFDARLFALASSLLVAAIVAWAFVWAWMVRHVSCAPVPLRHLAQVYLYSNAAKYVPGAIWNYVARAYLGEQQGVRPSRIWVATFVEIVGALFTGCTLYLVSVLLPHQHRPFLPAGALLVFSVLLLAAVSPPAMAVWVRLARSIRRQPWQLPVTFTYGWVVYAGFLVLSIAMWLVVGLAYFLLLQSLWPVPAASLMEVTGLVAFSVVASLIAIGVPQGIGIKEGVLTLGLGAIVPLPVALSIALLARVWLIAGDIMSVVLWWAAWRLEHRFRPRAT